MRIRRSVCSRASAMVAGALLTACIAAPAVAQEGSVAPGLQVAVANAVATSSPPAEPQAPAATPAPAAQATPPQPTPAEAAAKQDSATMSFFRDVELSGFVDTYYSYNFNKPTKSCGAVGGVRIFNCLHNFDVAHNSFSLNLAELALEKKPTTDSRGGFRIDLDYGTAAAMVGGTEPTGSPIYQTIQQAYLSYLAPTAKGSLQFDFGKFVTLFGNEVIETKDNWNYSRSLLFSLAIPYYHQGLRVIYSPNDKVSVAGYLVNGWNNSVDNNTGKTGFFQITYKPNAALTLVENYGGGPEANNTNTGIRQLSDTVLTYTVDKKTSLALNYDYGKDAAVTSVTGASGVTWQGVAAYLKYQSNDWFAIVPRYEYTKDKDGFMTGASQNVQEFTLTAEFKHKDGVLMRIEYRGDFSNTPYFFTDTSALKKTQQVFTIGWVYAFSTKAS